MGRGEACGDKFRVKPVHMGGGIQSDEMVGFRFDEFKQSVEQDRFIGPPVAENAVFTLFFGLIV